MDSIHDAKSPGPDGYTLTSKLFKLQWDQIQEELYSVITESFQTGQIIKGLNHAFLTIIPKKEKPQTLSNYRLAANANVLYKLATKILRNRFKHFLPYLISENQSTFIPG